MKLRSSLFLTFIICFLLNMALTFVEGATTAKPASGGGGLGALLGGSSFPWASGIYPPPLLVFDM
ncbi:hypothetical protein PGB90_009695 [Kerria lacca]